MATTQAVTKRQAIPPAMVAVIEAVKPGLPELLPPDISMEQFRAALWLELTGRPALYECTPASLRDCIVKAATYGLLPGRDVHILPFKNRKGNNKLATYVPNYFGIILALERTGKVRRAFAHAVYSKDVFEVDYFADRPVHKPVMDGDRGKLRCFYGCIILKDGSCHFEVMTLEQIDAIKKRSPAHEEGPWITDYEQMGRKTALKRVAKYVKLTPEIQGLLAEEDTRELEDIPEERHRSNLVDLFGPGADEAATPRDVTPKPPAKTTVVDDRDSIAWDTLTAHRDDADLPPELLERIAAALSPLAPASEGEAHVLASEVLDYLNNATTPEEA